MELKVITTGSRGNSYALKNDQGGYLILDAGVRYKELAQAVEWDPSYIHSVLITHEHRDHAQCVEDLAANGVDVCMSAGTAEMLFDDDDYLRDHVTICKAGDQFRKGPWLVMPFVTEHDAQEPLGFLIQERDTAFKLVYLTDTAGCKYRFNGLTHIIVECNYQLSLLNRNVASGTVAKGLHDRIIRSHMGLETLTEWLKTLDLSACRKIILVHLSDGNSLESHMVHEISKATGIEVVPAVSGSTIHMDLYDF